MRIRNVFAVVIVAILVCGSISGHAITLEKLEEEIARCAAIGGDLERLECYDALARSLGLVAVRSVLPPVEGTGKWQTSITTNPLDDSATVVLWLVADSGKSSWGDRTQLYLRCKSNKTEVYIAWHEYLGDGYVDVTWRIGDEQAVTHGWSSSADDTATFYPSTSYIIPEECPTGPIDFIRKLLTANRFVAQVTPYKENPITAVFDLTGLSNVIIPLQEACGWE